LKEIEHKNKYPLPNYRRIYKDLEVITSNMNTLHIRKSGIVTVIWVQESLCNTTPLSQWYLLI
jgi:hypothetical protein